MIAFILATRREAGPLLEALGVTPREDAEESVRVISVDVLGEQVVVCITGMGKEAARWGTEELLDTLELDEAVNIGIAGALGSEMEIGGLYRITETVDWPEGQETAERLVAGRFADLPEARLVTSRKPVFSDEGRKALRAAGDLVDMEGAVIAQVCAEKGVPLTAVKCVSDFAGDGDREILHRNLDRLSEKLAQLVIDRISGVV